MGLATVLVLVAGCARSPSSNPTATDADGDGFAPPDDCDDADPQVFPGAADAYYDGVDSDCAGDDDFDADHDGTARDADCDDSDALRFPGNVELLCDPVDGDCDGDVERADSCVIDAADAAFSFDEVTAYAAIGPDLSGDGRPDLYVLTGVSYEPGHGGSNENALSIWAQDGASVALAATVTSSGVQATSYFTMKGVESAKPAGDADGDGIDDLWVHSQSGTAYLLRGPLAGDIDLEAEALAAFPPSLLPADDVDGDGYGDLIGWEEVSFGPWTAAGPARTLEVDAWPVAAIDMDGARAIVGLAGEGLVALDSTTGDVLATWSGQFSYPMVAADTNGDGYDDFAAAAAGVYFGPIVDGARAELAVAFEDLDRDFAGSAGDVDADGAADLALNGPGRTFVVHANAPGQFLISDVSYELPDGTISIGPWSGARPVVAVSGYGAPVVLFDLSSWPIE